MVMASTVGTALLAVMLLAQVRAATSTNNITFVRHNDNSCNSGDILLGHPDTVEECAELFVQLLKHQPDMGFERYFDYEITTSSYTAKTCYAEKTKFTGSQCIPKTSQNGRWPSYKITSGFPNVTVDNDQILDLSGYASDVTNIALRGKDITVIPPFAFARFRSLSKLTIYYTDNFHEISDLSFRGITHDVLKFLGIWGNKVTRIPAGSFDCLRGLTTLEIGRTPIETLPPNLLRWMNQLRNLYLNRNELKEFPENFLPRTGIRYFMAYENKLTRLPDSFFEPLRYNPVQIWLNDNRLTKIPTSVAQLVQSQGQNLNFNNNNIREIPQAVASYLHSKKDTVLVSLHGNPSTCSRVYNVDEDDIDFLCDCAPGYYGENFCEPMKKHLVLPSINSAAVGLHIESHLLEGGVINTDIDPGVGYIPQFSSIPFTFKGNLTPKSLDVAAVKSIFHHKGFISYFEETFALSLYENTDTKKTRITFTDTFWNHRVGIIPEYDLTGALPEGITFNTTTGVFGGVPTSAGNSMVKMSVRDLMTGESSTLHIPHVAGYTFSVQECGSMTCLNGGTCDELGDPYDNVWQCNCLSNFTGSRCEVLLQTEVEVQVIQNASAASTSSEVLTSTSLGIIIAGGIVLLFLIGGLAFVFHRRHVYKKGIKFFHVFISYRQKTDYALVEKLSAELKSRFLKMGETNLEMKIVCFRDIDCIKVGREFQDVFLKAVKHCCVFIPIISNDMLQTMKDKAERNENDQVLKEHETAIALFNEKLRGKRRLQILPLFVKRAEMAQETRTTLCKDDLESLQADIYQYGVTGSFWGKQTHLFETMKTMFGYNGIFLKNESKLTRHVAASKDPTAGPPDESLVNEIMAVLARSEWLNLEYWNNKLDGKPFDVRGKLDKKMSRRFSFVHSEEAATARSAWGGDDSSSSPLDSYVEVDGFPEITEDDIDPEYGFSKAPSGLTNADSGLDLSKGEEEQKKAEH